MSRIVHLSDIHLRGREGKEYHNALALFRHINAQHAGDTVVITGDLCDDGRLNQIKALNELLTTHLTDVYTLLAPGNHDYALWGNLLNHDSYRNWHHHLGCPRAPRSVNRLTGPWFQSASEPWEHQALGPCRGVGLFIRDDVNTAFIAVDSADWEDREVLARGLVTPRQSRAVRTLLEHPRLEGFTRVVFLHHHPFIRASLATFTDYPEAWAMELTGATEFMEAVSGRCDLLLFGHRHVAETWEHAYGIPLIAAARKSTSALDGHLYYKSYRVEDHTVIQEMHQAPVR